MPKKETNPLRCAEKIREDWELTPVRVFKENGRPAATVEAALNLRDFEVRPYGVRHTDEVPTTFKVANGFAEGAVGHKVLTLVDSAVWRFLLVTVGACTAQQSLLMTPNTIEMGLIFQG